MSAQHTAHQLDNLSTGLLMAAMIGAERGRDRFLARQRQAQEIAAHNAGVARIRAARRHRDAAVASQIALGASRMDRWLDRVAH
jgi:hypothetical protein